MFDLKRNAVIGLNLSSAGGDTDPAAGGSSSSSSSNAGPAQGHLVSLGKDAAAPRVGCGGDAVASPQAAARSPARPSPIGAEGPYVTATPARPAPLALTPRAASPEAAAAIMSPEDELDGYEPEPPGKRAAPLRLLDLRDAGRGSGSDGSLPSTPPPAEEEEDELYRQSLDIISRYLREQAAGAKAAPPGAPAAASRKALETLRRVGDGVQRNHLTAFRGMLRKLEIKGEDDVKALAQVMVHVFSDGVTNWGRIVTLISFGAFVAKHLKSINQEGCIGTLAEILTDVLIRTKRDWLVKQRGWDGFVEFFHVDDLESGIRNVLLAFAGVAGVGAGLAYLIR